MRKFDHDHVLDRDRDWVRDLCWITPPIGYSCARSGNYVPYSAMIVMTEVVNLGLTNESTSVTE